MIFMETLSGKVAWNTATQVVGKVASTSVGVLITIILTRYLGPKGFGDYTFIMVFVLMFGSVADWGLSLIGVSEASKHPAEAGKIVGNVLVMRLFLAVVAMVMANITIRLLPHSPGLENLILIASIFIFIFSLKTSFQIIFNARLKMEYWAISELAANGAGVLLVLYLVGQNAGLTSLVWAMSFGQLISTLVAMFFAMRMVRFDFRIQKDLIARILKEALPVGALLVLFTVYNRVDIVILGYFKGAEAVGFYGAAYRVYEVLVLGAAYFANSILPILSGLAHKDKKRFKKIFVRSFVILAGLGILISMVNFLLAPLAIAVIGGAEFTASVLALQILSLAIVISYFNHLNGYAIIALGKQWFSFMIAIVAFAANLALNVWLIPKFSLYGAALNTFLTETIIVILSLIILRRQGGIGFGFSDLWTETKEIVLESKQRFL